MAQFSYRALTRDGKTQQGSVDAPSRDMATRQLRAQGFTLLSIEAGGAAAADKGEVVGKLKREHVLSLTSELAVLLRAGLPLDRALKVLIDMAAEPAADQVLRALLADVKGGKALSAALQPFEESFGTFYLSMVRAGEASGQLSAVLERLVEHLDNAKTTRDAVVSALIYPCILLVVACISVFAMLGFVVPQFEALFEDMGDALPMITRAVIAAGDFLGAYWWLILLLVAAVVFIVRQQLASEAGRLALHQRLLKLPIAGGIIFEFEMSKFARTVGTLLENGVSLLKAISIGIDTVDNRVLKQELAELAPAVKAGKRMSVTLASSGKFTPMVIQMLRVGEESGSLDQMLLELARVFDNNVQSGIKRGLALLEPVLILTMGAIIAFIIVAILMGILSVNNLAM
ncbi:MAG: type II secretion system protein F [Gammaproteobacteria bacterium]|nr:MAG: type II secretion system protein F [Gammaproteobacteria bacterium]